MPPDHERLREEIHERLKSVNDPELNRGIVELGMLKRCDVTEDGRADLQIELTTPACPLKDVFREDIAKALADLNLPGIEIEFTADVTRRAPDADRREIPGVRNVITVGAGKGGVGKTTVAVNLALALAQSGARVGLLDADIYGPNIPLMLGIGERPNIENDKIIPLEGHGLKIMSIGLLLEEETPVIWRGPMLHSAIGQFLFDVRWGELDYLLVDLPPGTGDVQLSMSQRVPVTGAVVVCTPSSVAVQDVRRAIRMFRQLNVPVLGLVENMRGFVCPECATTTDIFATDDLEQVAAQAEVPHLGAIPLSVPLRVGGDTGQPIQATDPEGSVGRIFTEIAQRMAAQISVANFASVS